MRERLLSHARFIPLTPACTLGRSVQGALASASGTNSPYGIRS
jgi:hypothetical protein